MVTHAMTSTRKMEKKLHVCVWVYSMCVCVCCVFTWLTSAGVMSPCGRRDRQIRGELLWITWLSSIPSQALIFKLIRFHSSSLTHTHNKHTHTNTLRHTHTHSDTAIDTQCPQWTMTPNMLLGKNPVTSTIMGIVLGENWNLMRISFFLSRFSPPAKQTSGRWMVRLCTEEPQGLCLPVWRHHSVSCNPSPHFP